MKFKFHAFLILLVLAISACASSTKSPSSTAVPNTQIPPSPIAIIPSPVTPTGLVVQNPTATSTLLPTLSLPNTATSTVLPAQLFNPASASPIQFGPNGTYADVVDSLTAGKSKTYSVRAMKGQVMSVSIHQNEQADWTYMTVIVLGEDGTRLCDMDCEFWRGVLPSTQNYLVTVTAPSDAPDFVLRVAINPPGAATQSIVYENKYRNASLSYTDMFAPAFYSGPEVSKIKPELALQFIDTQSFDNTNLIEAYFLFGSSTDSQDLSTCTQPASFGPAEAIVGETTINGVTFTKSQSSGVGAGNIYEQTYYRGVHNQTCYEITYYVHYGNIGNYDPGAVKEFDHDALVQRFDEILNTITFK